jgi:hypothetical protein
MRQLRDEIKTNPILYLVKKPEPPIKTYYVNQGDKNVWNLRKIIRGLDIEIDNLSKEEP